MVRELQRSDRLGEKQRTGQDQMDMVVSTACIFRRISLIQLSTKRGAKKIEKLLRVPRSQRKRRMELVDECFPMEGKRRLHLLDRVHGMVVENGPVVRWTMVLDSHDSSSSCANGAKIDCRQSAVLGVLSIIADALNGRGVPRCTVSALRA